MTVSLRYQAEAVEQETIALRDWLAITAQQGSRTQITDAQRRLKQIQLERLVAAHATLKRLAAQESRS